jgi:hypothetical protein
LSDKKENQKTTNPQMDENKREERFEELPTNSAIAPNAHL